MGKYTVKHKCGCEMEYQLFGKLEDRYKRLEYLQQQDCWECYHKKVAELSRELNLPVLKGTERQISWAESIRMGKLNDREIMEGARKYRTLTPEQQKSISETYKIERDKERHTCPPALYAAAIFLEESSKWWIEHR